MWFMIELGGLTINFGPDASNTALAIGFGFLAQSLYNCRVNPNNDREANSSFKGFTGIFIAAMIANHYSLITDAAQPSIGLGALVSVFAHSIQCNFNKKD